MFQEITSTPAVRAVVAVASFHERTMVRAGRVSLTALASAAASSSSVAVRAITSSAEQTQCSRHENAESRDVDRCKTPAYHRSRPSYTSTCAIVSLVLSCAVCMRNWSFERFVTVPTAVYGQSIGSDLTQHRIHKRTSKYNWSQGMETFF